MTCGRVFVSCEPEEKTLRIRYRIDGLLQTQVLPPEIARFQAAIISRIKIMAHLNIAEKRLPQDGRIKMRVHNHEIDVRVSIIPMIWGEGIVMRLLDKTRMVFNLANVGMLQDTYSLFKKLLDLPHGIILVTGPTGSGKSTTLYNGTIVRVGLSFGRLADSILQKIARLCSGISGTLH